MRPENGDEIIQDSDEGVVGFEIFQLISPDEVIVWVNIDGMTEAEFDSLQLPQNWSKNTPREGAADAARFTRSPGAQEDGVFTEVEHFGRMWQHNATIVNSSVALNDTEGLLTASSVAKFHEVTYFAGRTLDILVSPAGDQHIIVARDPVLGANPPTIPSAWQLTQKVLSEDLIILLPNPTLNIRTDNLDTYQGPIPA